MKHITMIIVGLVFASMGQAFEFPQAEDAWVREAPPSVKMLAGYVTLNNQSDETKTLVGAYAPDFGLAEIHQTIEQDGVYRMQEQAELVIAPGAELRMQPKGLHVMLMMPTRALKAGDETKICLIYRTPDGQTEVQHLMFPVKQP